MAAAARQVAPIVDIGAVGRRAARRQTPPALQRAPPRQRLTLPLLALLSRVAVASARQLLLPPHGDARGRVDVSRRLGVVARVDRARLVRHFALFRLLLLAEEGFLRFLFGVDRGEVRAEAREDGGVAGGAAVDVTHDVVSRRRRAAAPRCTHNTPR